MKFCLVLSMNLMNIFLTFSANEGTDSVRAGVRKESKYLCHSIRFVFRKHMAVPVTI